MKDDEAAILLLSELVSIRSINGTEGELAAAGKIADYLRAAGLEATLLCLDNARANVFVTLKGREEQGGVVWNGHLDTVALGEPSAWSKGYAAAAIEGNRLYGRGSSDMKAGLAAMIFCLASWAHSGRLPRVPIFFCATCDEENNGKGAEALLDLEEIRTAEMFLISEPTALNVCFAEKGCLRLLVKVYGKTSHAAYADQGINAVDYAVNLGREIKRRMEDFSHPLLGRSSAVITRIHAGTAHNMVPDLADMLLDLRTTPDLGKHELDCLIDESIQTIIKASGGKIRIETEYQNRREPIGLSKNSKWGNIILSAANGLDIQAAPCGINFFSDASVFVRANPRAEMVLCGPGEPEVAHQPDEYVDLQKYLNYIRLLKELFG